LKLSKTSLVPTSISLEAVVIRANGDREPLGEIAYYHRSRVKRLVYRIQHRGVGRIRPTDKKE
jgi:hypothetical protein